MQSSLPDYPPSRLSIIANWSVTWSACAALALLVVRRIFAEWHANPEANIRPLSTALFAVGKNNQLS